MTIGSLDNSTPTAVVNKDNKVDKSDGGRTSRNLTKFKSFKNSVKCKKLIRNLVKFKIFKELSFLKFATRLAYT